MNELDEGYADFSFIENATNTDLSRRENDRNNATRPAVVEMLVKTTGVGQQRVKAALVFPIIFRDQPHFTCGSALINNPQEGIWHDPVGTSGVYMWVRDSRGYFIGAKVWTRVDAYLKVISNDSGADPGPPIMKVQHFLTFSGTGIKLLPSSGLDPKLTPRTTNLMG